MRIHLNQHHHYHRLLKLCWRSGAINTYCSYSNLPMDPLVFNSSCVAPDASIAEDGTSDDVSQAFLETLKLEKVYCKAARAGNMDILEPLKLAPASCAVMSSLLSVAAGFGHVSCVQFFLELEASPNISSSLDGNGQRPLTQRTALHRHAYGEEGNLSLRSCWHTGQIQMSALS